MSCGEQTFPYLGVLALAVPAGIEVADTSTQGGGDGVARLSVRLRDAVVHGIDLLHKVLIQLKEKRNKKPNQVRAQDRR